MTQNALIRKNGEFIIKDQIIFKYSKPVTAQEVKQQAGYFLGKKAIENGIGIKSLDKKKHVFLIAAKGAHLLNGEDVASGFVKGGTVPPPPRPIYPSDIMFNTLIIKQTGLKNESFFKASSFMK